MHELGLALNIVDIVQQHVPAIRASDVRDVRVRVGEFAGVLPDSLEFCFSAIVAGTPWQRARLAIEPVPGGRDLQIMDVEMDDGAVAAEAV